MNDTEWRLTYGVSGSEKLPLVTIIVINWNYGAYLPMALQSVASQDYPSLEVITLDNGSSDESPSLFQAFAEQHPQVRFIRLDRNLGQLGAAHHIFTQHSVSGEFVSFLDSDDFLFPHFISHHVRAHSLVNNGAGVSTSDTIQVDGQGTIVAGNMPRWWKNPAAKRLGWVDIQLPTAHTPPKHLATTLIPSTERQWCWYPGTSIVYRRSHVEPLMAAIRAPVPVRFALDTSAAPFSHAPGGTIMLNEALSGYRIHGKNSSVTAPQLQYFDSGRATFSKLNQRQERWYRKNFRNKIKAS